MQENGNDSLLLPFEDSRSSRRGFLQLVGFGIAGATMSGCTRGPLTKVVPALTPEEGVIPGRAYWIATTCDACEAGCGVLAKCRDGRPIKLEGNPDHPLSRGGLCAVGQANVLGLYDGERFASPLRGSAQATWAQLDGDLAAAFAALESGNGRVRLLTGTLHSPSTRAFAAGFLARFADGRHVIYDGLPASAMLDAHEAAFGRRSAPSIHFDRASTIVSFDADFLSTWISPVAFTRDYTAGRTLDSDAGISRHIQFEGRMSLTGTRADERVRLTQDETRAAIAGLCDALEQKAGAPQRMAGALESAPRSDVLQRVADELWATRGRALVVAGANDFDIQIACAYANQLVDAYGTTLDLDQTSNQRLGDDRAVEKLRSELAAGEVDALIISGVNPGYDWPVDLPLESAGLVVACAALPDETTARANWVAPLAHGLERWDDAEPVEGLFGLSQPTVPRLRAGRSLRESLARWSGDTREDLELLREHWRTSVFPRQSTSTNFDAFFDAALERGFFAVEPSSADLRFDSAAVRPPGARVQLAEGELELVLYPKIGVLDGRHAHNPWLQELPDPVSKLAWDNYACLAPLTASELGFEEGDIVRIADGIELPVHVQPGQHEKVVAVALGYGRSGTDRFTGVGPDWIDARPTVEPGGTIGVRALQLSTSDAAARRTLTAVVTLEATGKRDALASTQDHHSLEMPDGLAPHGAEVRNSLAPTATFAAWSADPHAAMRGMHTLPKGELWTEDHAGPVQWGMTIDMSRCTGCSSCVLACQAENNVPVVGKDEVRRHREMSWLRIDRYFQGEGDEVTSVHQPMMCQQCGHAPCEAVCPVLATVHSSEGLNSQVYNRCVGTRYCANTCPYKVRRFNWFDYERDDALQNATLNPDVTVRSRGVMEKCSFCIQRIQEAKALAKLEGREVRDGDIRTACQQSCPADAIVFGNLNDETSRVAGLARDPRAFELLEELNVRPAIRYMARIHNGREETARHDD